MCHMQHPTWIWWKLPKPDCCTFWGDGWLDRDQIGQLNVGWCPCDSQRPKSSIHETPREKFRIFRFLPILLHMGKNHLCVQGYEANFPTNFHETRQKLCLGNAINASAKILKYLQKWAPTEQNTEVPEKWTNWSTFKIQTYTFRPNVNVFLAFRTLNLPR